jgi:hypothetical protein
MRKWRAQSANRLQLNRGREDGGAGIFGPQIQNLLIAGAPDSVRFSTSGKIISESEIHGKGEELCQ